MGRVPLETTRVPQRKVGMPLPPSDLGQFPIAQKRRQAQVVAAGVGQIGQVVADYAQKHKGTDMAADEAAFSLFSKDRMTQAESAAARTADPEEVKKIYSNAEADIEGYIGTTNEGGTPNIRWRDQQEDLRNKIQPMKGRIREIAGNRILGIYKADKKAKVDRMAADAISRGDMGGVRDAAKILSSLATPEQVKGFVAEAEREIAGAESLNMYNQNIVSMQVVEELRLDGEITDDDFFDGLNEIRDNIDTSGMTDRHKQAVRISVSAKINNQKGRRVTNRDKAIRAFKKLREGDNVTASALEELEAIAGKVWSDAFESTIMASLSTKATSDKGASKIYDTIVSYQNGEMSTAKALHNVGKTTGQHAEMGVYLIGRLAEDQANGSGAIIAYDSNYNGVPSKIDSTTTDFVTTLGEYMASQPPGTRARYFSQRFFAYDRWRDSQPEATRDDYIAWRNETFKSDSQAFVSKKSAPQVPAQKQEWKDGDTRTHPVSGITYTMKDGKWQK